jgi:type IV secretion system protein VirB5
LITLLIVAVLPWNPTNAIAGGIPVIDVAAIAQLIQQVRYWQQQIAGMNNQLQQLQTTYASLTGTRGMDSLLPMSNAQRNYLPPNYAALMSTINGNSVGYAGLSRQVQSAMATNAVLSNAQLDKMTPEMRQAVQDARRATALISSMSQMAYQNTSQRFAALQQLITAIRSAGDMKAMQDLQGRVSAEQAMLQNEQTKLQSAYQMAQADQWTQQQRMRERSAADVGSVNSLNSVGY